MLLVRALVVLQGASRSLRLRIVNGVQRPILFAASDTSYGVSHSTMALIGPQVSFFSNRSLGGVIIRLLNSCSRSVQLKGGIEAADAAAVPRYKASNLRTSFRRPSSFSFRQWITSIRGVPSARRSTRFGCECGLRPPSQSLTPNRSSAHSGYAWAAKMPLDI